jgi:hypothetical protein
VTRTTAMFLGDSAWRNAPRSLGISQASGLVAKLVADLKPGFGLKVPTASYRDARAICVHVPKESRRRLIFCPAVPFVVGESEAAS